MKITEWEPYRLVGQSNRGINKPHLFYNRATKRWICWHRGIGYIYAPTMREAYMDWLDRTGLQDQAHD